MELLFSAVIVDILIKVVVFILNKDCDQIWKPQFPSYVTDVIFICKQSENGSFIFLHCNFDHPAGLKMAVPLCSTLS